MADGDIKTSGPIAGQDRKAGKAGLGLLGKKLKKKKEDSSVTLGKFMKAKVDALNESVKGGGMKADRVIEGSNMRRKKDFRKDIEEGKYKQTKDADYYKSIGLTGKRGDAAVEDFFKPFDQKRMFNKGGKVKLALKGGGRAFGKNS